MFKRLQFSRKSINSVNPNKNSNRNILMQLINKFELSSGKKIHRNCLKKWGNNKDTGLVPID